MRLGFAFLVNDLSTEERERRPADDRRSSTCASLLVSMLKADKVRLLLIEQFASKPTSTADEDYDNNLLVTMLVSMPERVANATRTAPPPSLTPTTFFRNLATEFG